MKSITTLMELKGLEAFKPFDGEFPDITIRRETDLSMSPDLWRELHKRVGEPCQWFEWWNWPDDKVVSSLTEPSIHFYVARRGDSPVGFYELFRYGDNSEAVIEKFGLVPEEMGRGLGKYLLTHAVRLAFSLGAQRITLETYSEDHPHAIPNYLARGFVVVRITEEESEG